MTCLWRRKLEWRQRREIAALSFDEGSVRQLGPSCGAKSKPTGRKGPFPSFEPPGPLAANDVACPRPATGAVHQRVERTRIVTRHCSEKALMPG